MSNDNALNEAAVPAVMLFVTGNAPRSRRARKNLASALAAMGLESVKPMEIDLLARPEKTVTYSVFATPALLCTDDHGHVRALYGDLSDEEKLREFLQDIADD
ncbi:MAG: hypothetical protein ACLFSC_07945 [Wenzhouxiangella sp.]